MHCGEFETRLNEVLDHRGDPRRHPLLAEHAEECHNCREQMAGLLLALEGLAGMASPVSSSDLPLRVAGELRSLRRRPLVVRWWGLAAAAAILIVATPLLFAPLADTPTTKSLSAARTTGQGAGPTNSVSGGFLPRLEKQDLLASLPWSGLPRSTESEISYLMVARQAGVSVATAVQFVAGSQSDSLGPPSGVPATGAGWLDGVTDSLRPLTRSASGAINSVWRALPVGASERRS